MYPSDHGAPREKGLPEDPSDHGAPRGQELPMYLSDHGAPRGRELPMHPSDRGIARGYVAVEGPTSDRVVTRGSPRGVWSGFGSMGSGYGAPAFGQLSISALADVLHLHDPSSITFSLLLPSLDDLIEEPGKYLETRAAGALRWHECRAGGAWQGNQSGFEGLREPRRSRPVSPSPP